ncbi:MAG TPA: aminotransferase class V-fold PLP-dependent enzyme [Solirubrobacteraceae bacterium]|nr:aminotransferase class V-fold PLP-dependent enzyme [Solirubrobacteraceae bacterium]
MDLSELRAEFPVLRDVAYLNAGTDGPLAARAVEAATRALRHEADEGRSGTHFEQLLDLRKQLRGVYAGLLHCEPADVALTTCTSEGIAQVLSGLELEPGDEILTSDEEHPGLLGALAAARELRGASVRTVPLARIAESVGPATRLVACCHVGWMSGSLAPADLADVDVPVLFDGAQGIGAIGVDVAALGCDAYAASGQKWLCGPDGTGSLYVSPRLREQIAVSRRGFGNLADPNAGLEARVHDDARRLDTFSLNRETLACALAACGVLADAGWDAVHERALGLAATLVARLREAGRDVAPRDRTTLVSFTSDDPPAERARLAERGVVVRNIPGRPWLRASVGAWNDADDLGRLLAALAPA